MLRLKNSHWLLVSSQQSAANKDKRHETMSITPVKS
jgi:hypothetical protein